MSAYFELLRDPRWQRKRLQILSRSDFSCEECGATDKTLNVHHRVYRKGAKPWEYADDELQALCEDCHEHLHGIQARMKVALAKLSKYELEEALGMVEGMLAARIVGDTWPDNLQRERQWTMTSFMHGAGFARYVLSRLTNDQYFEFRRMGALSDLDIHWLTTVGLPSQQAAIAESKVQQNDEQSS